MDNITWRIARLGLVMVLMVVSLGLVYYEAWWLSQNKQSSVVTAAEGNQVDLAAFGAEGQVLSETVSIESADARVEIVKRYLEKYKSPLIPYAQMIVDLSDTYGFDYYWIVAIGQQESNLCKKIPEGSHNCWGYGINSAGTLKFENYEIALTSYAEYLKREYFDKGYDTPEKIMKKYCPHSNGSWAFGVNKFINQMENGLI